MQSYYNECVKHPVVGHADAIVDPRAVMVKLVDTLVTLEAVTGSRGS
jgi:hypothetical protein